MRGVDLVDFDAFYFCQLLHAALHLHGFCGLIAEPFNESLGVGDFFLLVQICTGLLLDAFFTQFDKFGIVDGVVIDFAA